MQSKRLGKSAIAVSDICMGTMTFGNQADEAMSIRILDMAFDAGINFFDTAENYPVPPDPSYAGRTEEILGRWMDEQGLPSGAIEGVQQLQHREHGDDQLERGRDASLLTQKPNLLPEMGL